MMLGRTDESRSLYLGNRGKIASGSMSWEDAVESDFAALRKAGVAKPLMEDVEAEFAKPLPPKP